MMGTRTVVGEGWTLKVDVEGYAYESTGDARRIVEMVEGEFPLHEIARLYSMQFETGDAAGHLPEDIVSFLLRWGIKAHLEPESLAARMDDPDVVV